jgi:hypothetical protein
MFASSILDVVIGLFFVFFVCSLAVSGINEFVRKLLNTRAKALWTSIDRMLDGSADAPQPDGLTARLGSAPPRGPMLATSGPAAGGVDVGLARRLYDHPAIGRLDPTRLGAPSRITHIPPTDFARALVDLLTPDDPDGNKRWDQLDAGIAQLPRPLRSQFQLLHQEAEGNVLRFRQAVEGWFEDGMTRVSVWYKKRTRVAMFGYGLAVAVLFNVSAVNVTRELYADDVVRQTVVQLAGTEIGREGIENCTDRTCVQQEVGKLVDTGLPVLWRTCSGSDGASVRCGFEDGWAVTATIAGWLITAAALSVGAAFWFALLQRAFRLRTAAAGTRG